MDHTASGPPSPVPPSPLGSDARGERMATVPEMRAVEASGGWEVPQIPRESTADRALRIALQVRAYVGRPPQPAADGKIDDGLGLSKLVYGINAKLDKAIEFIQEANDAAAGRKKTAGELAWIVVRWAVPFALALAWTLLSGHVTFH